MTKWFRFYSEVLNDPKVQLLPPDVFKTWVNILCIAAENDGQLGTTSQIAFSLRVTECDARAVTQTLLDAGLLDARKGHYIPHNWSKRQYKSDTSAERMRRHRERHRHRHCDVTVTPPETETDTDTDRKEKNTKKEKIKRELSRALDAVRVAAVIAHRRELKKPLTEHAAKLLANQFLELPDPNAGADLMIERGWQGFNAGWFENANAPPGRNVHEFQPRPKSANGQMFDALKEIAENERVTIDHEPDRRAPRLIGRASNDG